MTLDEVVASIRPADAGAMRAAMGRQQRLTKPPGSLGRLEDVSIQLAGIFGTERPIVRNTTLIVAAADHGVVAQGVTGYPQAVTAQMVLNFLGGGAAINVMARARGVELVIVDAGIAAPLPATSAKAGPGRPEDPSPQPSPPGEKPLRNPGLVARKTPHRFRPKTPESASPLGEGNNGGRLKKFTPPTCPSGFAKVSGEGAKAAADSRLRGDFAAGSLPAQPDLRVVAPGRGTKDMTGGPAMSVDQAEACVKAGIEVAGAAAERGAQVIATGDMGIGNTTAASAITAALTGASPRETTGRGTGRTDRELEHKIACVARALDVNRPDPDCGLDVLTKVGGFEIGVLAGVVLGGALARRAVVLDGYVSGAAGLIAASLCPAVLDYVIAGHVSAEPGHRVALRHLGLRPLLDLDMRLGEGTGALLATGLVEIAAACLSEMATFEEAGVSDREAADAAGSTA